MRQGFSRRGWLLGLFAGLAGLAGLRRRATAAPTVSRPEGIAPAFWTSAQWAAYLKSLPAGSVMTHVYDAVGKQTTVSTHGQVTTFDYSYKPPDRLT